MTKLLGVTPIGGRVEREWLHTDDYGRDVITTETVQDVEPILDRCKAEFNEASTRFGQGSFHKVATIPFTVFEEVSRIQKIPFRELIEGKSDLARRIWNMILNGRDLSAFRTRPGRVEIARP